jgi:transcriptional regulator with GAF, ATPase, and Fis domain
VLQENEFEAVGSSRTIKVDVRVIAATNRDLAKSVEAGQFREDLFYRLNVFPLTVPPLRARREDIAPLANAFLANTLRKFGRRVQTFTTGEIERLDKYDWPGNVRELQNVIERAVISSQDGRPNLDRALPLSTPPQLVAAPTKDHGVLTVAEVQDLEKRNIMLALQKCDWRIAGESGAAKLLGMKPSTLTSRMASLGITRVPLSKSL